MTTLYTLKDWPKGGGRRSDRGNVRRSIGRRAECGRRTTKGNGGQRTERSFYFVLVPPGKLGFMVIFRIRIRMSLFSK